MSRKEMREELEEKMKEFQRNPEPELSKEEIRDRLLTALEEKHVRKPIEDIDIERPPPMWSSIFISGILKSMRRKVLPYQETNLIQMNLPRMLPRTYETCERKNHQRRNLPKAPKNQKERKQRERNELERL